jgi:hypothetical protein
MGGDNLDYDVPAPMGLGIPAMWVSRQGGALLADRRLRPLGVRRSMCEMLGPYRVTRPSAWRSP